MIRGACSECGYRAWIEPNGTVPAHEVRRVHFGPNGRAQVYKGTEDGDERCAGAGQAPTPMPPRVIRRAAAHDRADIQARSTLLRPGSAVAA
jgi:hypothetical protein